MYALIVTTLMQFYCCWKTLLVSYFCFQFDTNELKIFLEKMCCKCWDVFSRFSIFSSSTCLINLILHHVPYLEHIYKHYTFHCIKWIFPIQYLFLIRNKPKLNNTYFDHVWSLYYTLHSSETKDILIKLQGKTYFHYFCWILKNIFF